MDPFEPEEATDPAMPVLCIHPESLPPAPNVNAPDTLPCPPPDPDDCDIDDAAGQLSALSHPRN